MPVLILFFCSGATALVYEVVWSKYLSLMFGSTVQAQTVVLAVFMGGLALGNRLFGALAGRAQRPLAIYGWLEIGIGLYAVAFRPLYGWADEWFVRLGSGLLGNSAALLALKGTLAVGLLLGPTILMGGTLPLMAAWLQKVRDDPGRRSARFYSVNSLGAVFGSFLAGFYLIRELGLVVTLQMTALANVLIGLAAIVLARFPARAPAKVEADLNTPGNVVETAADSAVGGGDVVWLRSGCLVVALTGAVSMGLEVLAARCLALIFGASLQAFALVLMAFILGIGLGSAVAASPRWRRPQPELTTMALLLATAGWVGLFVGTIEDWVFAYRVVKSGLAATTTGHVLHQLFVAAVSFVVLGVPAALLGAVLPLWMRAGASGGTGLPARVGRLLTWNTMGAVSGVLATGFVLMPAAGLRGAFVALALALCTVALVLALGLRARGWMLAAGGLGLGLTVMAGLTGGHWRHALSSGVFRLRETEVDRSAAALRKQHTKLLFYEDAADATVVVEQGDGVGESDQLALRINGKVDASSKGDLCTQYLLGHLPMLARPESKEVFVLGFGSGVTAGALLTHPLERLVIAENCAPVLRAAKWFEPWNRGVLSNRLAQAYREDARTVLKLGGQRYDIIISEPSNPWMAGVGSVFSREFYELCASRLKPGGIMTQWFHVYEMSDDIVNMVLRTFTSVFPHLEIWDSGTGDIILLGSQRPWPGGLDNFRRVWERPLAVADLSAIGLDAPETLWVRLLASQRTAFAIPDNGPVQSDEWPLLEYDAPKAFFLGRHAKVLEQFDERTWQHPLADPVRRQILQTLTDQQLDRIFHEFSSVNGDLTRYLDAREKGMDQMDRGLFVGIRLIPSVFRPPQPRGANVFLPEDASPQLARLLTAERLLEAMPERWEEFVGVIEEVLIRHGRDSVREKAPWSPGHYIAVAARACLQHGDYARARKILSLSAELGRPREVRHLERILQRESPGR